MVAKTFPITRAGQTRRSARPSRTARAVVALATAVLLATAVHAEDSPETARLRDALRQTSAKLQETESQLEQAQLAVAAAEHERDALKQQAPAAKKDDVRAAALQRQLAESAQQLAQARADGQRYQAAQQASDQLAQGREAERSALAGQLAQLHARVDRCAAGNDVMYRAGMDIVAMYRDPDFTNHLHDFHLSPLGFARVKQENRMRALEDRFANAHAKVEECRNAPAALATARPTSSPAAAGSPPQQAAASPSSAQQGTP